jgi:hypothetical protein
MRQRWIWISAFGLVVSVSAVQAQNWNSVLNHVGKTVEDRVNGESDKAVNKAFDKTDDTVNCVAGDPSCAKPAAAAGSAKCIATDTDCLKQAKAHGQTVEIVDEDEVDTLRCSSSDASCLQRAKKLGKKVEITD